MTIYVCLLLGIILLGISMKPNNSNKRKKIYMIIVSIALIIVSAIRHYTVGVDTEQYAKAYQIIRNIDFFNYSTLRYEVGFFSICKFLNYFTDNYQALMICTSFFIFGTMGWFIYKNSKDVIMSSILFITLNYYALYMSAMRQAIAVAILAIAFELLKKKKYIKYIILVLIASLFHQSAVVMLLLIFFTDKKFKVKNIYATIIISISAFLLANSVFNVITKIFPIYSGYGESQFFKANYFAALINTLVSLVILLVGVYCNSKSDEDKDKNLLAYIMCLNYIFYVITMKISIFSRVTIYFSYFSTIWLANSINNIQIKEQKILVQYIVVLCTILYWLIISIYRPEWHGVVPYKTFF